MNDETNNDINENIPIAPIMAVICDMHLRIDDKLYFMKEGSAARIRDRTPGKERTPIPYDVLINIHAAILSRNELWTYEGNTSDPGVDEFLGYGMGTFTRVFFGDKTWEHRHPGTLFSTAFFEYSRSAEDYYTTGFFFEKLHDITRVVPPSAYSTPLEAYLFQKMASRSRSSENLLPVFMIESGPDDDTAGVYSTQEGYKWLAPVPELPLLLSLPYDILLKRTPGLSKDQHRNSWDWHVYRVLEKYNKHILYVGMVKEELEAGDRPLNAIVPATFPDIYRLQRRKKLFPYDSKEPLACIDKDRREMVRDILIRQDGCV